MTRTTAIETILSQGGERVTCPYCQQPSAAYPHADLSGGTICPNCRETIHYDGERVCTTRETMDDPDTVWLCPQCYRNIDGASESSLAMCGACGKPPAKFVRERSDGSP